MYAYKVAHLKEIPIITHIFIMKQKNNINICIKLLKKLYNCNIIVMDL